MKLMAWKVRHIGLIGILILGMVAALACDRSGNRPVSVVKPSGDGVEDAIRKSAYYLVNVTGKDGLFKYRINLDSRIRVPEKYNILRHAGTIYAMVMFHERHPDAAMAAAIKRAGRYLQKEAVLPLAGEEAMLAVWSKPEVNRTGKPLQAKLGGTGLGLVALAGIERMSPGFTPLLDLKALGRFIVYMQNEDGSFCSKYIPALGGKQHDWDSLYYPGEAALGLLMLYELDPSPVWLASAYRVLEYLARTRENSRRIPADHWALLATGKLMSLERKGGVAIDEKKLVNHAVQICESILRNQVHDPERPRYHGGFANDGRTTPAATRLEGLIAALDFLPRDLEVRKSIEASVPQGIAFLVQAQIRDGEFSGAMPRAVGMIEGEKADPETRAFNRRVTEVRIDYVQHAMSAMIQYQAMGDL